MSKQRANTHDHFDLSTMLGLATFAGKVIEARMAVPELH